MRLGLLGGLTPAQFMRRHWQKRPLFVRGALPGFRDLLSERSLAALAARDDVESRLLERRGGRWKLRHGPIGQGALERAGKRDWTLLASGLNLHLGAADALLRRFDFVPQARLDDVMVSYAVRGGGVGAHVDSYDVFLLQGSGRRRWRVARPRKFQTVEGSPLRQLKRFVAEEEYVAGPGDLLYLPPDWAHEGVALEPCFTYSIGFRAPGSAELGAAFLDWLHERALPRPRRYRDPDLAPARHPARIPAGMVRFAVSTLGSIRWSARDVAEFLGRYLSTPKPHVFFGARPGRMPALASAQIRLDPKTQLLYRGGRFYMNGESLSVASHDAALLRELADRRSLAGRRVRRAALRALILQWGKDGFLHLEATR